jgi:PTS system N-acetylgalactosamine-specific IIA component
MIAGENELVKYVCFKEGMNTEQLAEDLIAAYNSLGDCDGIIVLSDLPGGSPFRTAVESSMTLPEKKIIVLSGTNLPMIITAATMASFSDDAEAMAEELLFEGKDNVVRFAMTEREEVEEDEDGI